MSEQTSKREGRIDAAFAAFADGQGGKLFFAGTLTETSASAIAAATKAGAAALVVAEELAAGKAAMRAGTVNFLVNSLDEALRILKNEIRKKQPVAVAVVGELGAIVTEMKVRGVQPEYVLEDAGLGGAVVEVN